MALTQISENGVKTDAITHTKLADDCVGASELVDSAVSGNRAVMQNHVRDDIIDEARLQISNAGTNGQFLQKQSGNTGGLTWADANQYTHPNHTGEVTSTADGAQVIADDVVDEANLKVSNSPTNGYFLSAQSGNTGGLTWAEVQAAPTVTAVASGTLTAGKVVHLMSDGKVKVATETAAAITSTTFEDSTYYAAGCYDTVNDKIVVVWSDGTSGDYKGESAVGTVDSNGDISFGSMVEFQGQDTRYIDCCFDAGRGVVAVIYSNYDNNKKPAVILGKVSGTSISWAGNDNLNNEESTSNSITAGPSNKVLAQYRDGDYGHRANAITIDSDGQGFSNSIQTIDGKSRYYSAAWSPSLERWCVAYQDQADSNKLKAQLLNDGAASQTGANASAIEIASAASQTTVGWDSVSEKFIVFTQGKAWVGTAGSSSLTFGSAVNVDAGDSCESVNGSMQQIGTSKFRFFYKKWDSGDKYKYVDGTVSGTSITFDTPVQMGSAGNARTLVWNEDNSTFYYVLQSNGGDGKVGRFTPASSSVNDENYLGFASANYSDGDTATINIVGNTITQSSLTPGQKYYATNDGGISTSTGSANVAVGKALTSTNLLIL